ncbi:MAG TPA: hypothetical protein VMA13_02200 [Candidatus Saccharimonadales bacterium]|nr:hypothetical protein [Candidatus Saccharimonadales bacterium]
MEKHYFQLQLLGIAPRRLQCRPRLGNRWFVPLSPSIIRRFELESGDWPVLCCCVGQRFLLRRLCCRYFGPNIGFSGSLAVISRDSGDGRNGVGRRFFCMSESFQVAASGPGVEN